MVIHFPCATVHKYLAKRTDMELYSCLILHQNIISLFNTLYYTLSLIYYGVFYFDKIKFIEII